MRKRIVMGADHAGFALKKALIPLLEQVGKVEDMGSYGTEAVDYPLYAHEVARAVATDETAYGVLLCSTGQGMAMAVNKHPNVRGAMCINTEYAMLARAHNDAQVVCLGAKYTTEKQAYDIIMTFINTPFEGGRHTQRVASLSNINVPNPA